MQKRTFENASDNKFWEIWVDGTTVYTRFGATGSKGQTKLKEHTSADDATGDVDKQVLDKLKKGFAEQGAAPAELPALDKKELARHLKGLKPGDPGVLVLADWLQTQNHPWGELIVLQHNAKTKKALKKEVDNFLLLHGPSLLGPAAKDKHSSFDWTDGFVRRAVLACEAEPKAIQAAVKELLAQPIAALVEAIVVSPYPSSFRTTRDWGQWDQHVVDPWDVDKLAKAIPDRIAHVGFGGWPAPAAEAYVHMPSFAKISSAFPKLRTLELTGLIAEKPGKLSLPELVELDVRFAVATDAALEAIASSKLPKLERLSIWLGGTSNVVVDSVHYPAEYEYEDDEDEMPDDFERYPERFSADDLEAMEVYDVNRDVGPEAITGLLNKLGGKVVHLGLRGTRFNGEVITALAKSKALKQLKTLDLSGGSFDDDAVKALVGAAKALAHLESIDLTDARFPDKATAKLEKALPNAKVKAVKELRPDFHMRYFATME